MKPACQELAPLPCGSSAGTASCAGEDQGDTQASRSGCSGSSACCGTNSHIQLPAVGEACVSCAAPGAALSDSTCCCLAFNWPSGHATCCIWCGWDTGKPGFVGCACCCCPTGEGGPGGQGTRGSSAAPPGDGSPAATRCACIALRRSCCACVQCQGVGAKCRRAMCAAHIYAAHGPAARTLQRAAVRCGVKDTRGAERSCAQGQTSCRPCQGRCGSTSIGTPPPRTHVRQAWALHACTARFLPGTDRPSRGFATVPDKRRSESLGCVNARRARRTLCLFGQTGVARGRVYVDSTPTYAGRSMHHACMHDG